MVFSLETFVKDYIDRTNYNLLLLDSSRDSQDKQPPNYQELMSPLHFEQVSSRLEEGKHYFELTSVLNSLFGVLLVPSEAFLAKRPNKTHSNLALVRAVQNTAMYPAFKIFIRVLESEKRFYISNGFPRRNLLEQNDVIFFLTMVRNSLAHSGQGGISFYPLSLSKTQEPLNTITHVLFYNYYFEIIAHTSERIKHESIVLLKSDELKVLYELSSRLFSSLNQGFAFTAHQYTKKVEELIRKMGYEIKD